MLLPLASALVLVDTQGNDLDPMSEAAVLRHQARAWRCVGREGQAPETAQARLTAVLRQSCKKRVNYLYIHACQSTKHNKAWPFLLSD